MIHGSLFSGIGGFDLASEWMEWQNAFHCEYNPFCQRVLKYYWPNAATYTDIRETDFTVWRNRLDILTGGFPCQPYSTAGKRKGKDDERHLWPEMLRAVRESRPRWIVGENVRGLVSWSGGLVFEEVQADLEAEGYEVQPFVLPAASIGAPHKRERVWFVAYANGGRIHNGYGTEESSLQGKQPQDREQQRNGRPGKITGYGKGWPTPHTTSQGLPKRPKTGNGRTPRTAPKRKELEKTSATRDWSEFPTQSPVLPGDDGLPAQLAGYSVSGWYKEFISGPGNAVVPQVVYRIFKAIEAYEKV